MKVLHLLRDPADLVAREAVALEEEHAEVVVLQLEGDESIEVDYPAIVKAIEWADRVVVW
ncbi:MAG: hypothetical protein ACYDGR_05270 [Candidatus Dormibacteria bacterium]